MGYRLDLGFDRGNERTNAAAITPDGKLVELDMPSLVAEGNLCHYQTVQRGASLNGVSDDGNIFITYEDMTYFLGDFALSGDKPTNGYGDMNRYKGKHTKLALMACAVQLGTKVWGSDRVKDLSVNLVMGVPIQSYRDESDKIAQALLGSYNFQYRGRGHSIHVDNVRVFMEGAGAAIYHGLDSSASLGIVDSGSYTTNVLRFNGPKADAKECFSFDIGVGSATTRLNTRFEQQYGRDLSLKEQQQILRAAIGQASYPEVWVDGECVPESLLRDWIQKAIAETGAERNTRIAQGWNKTTMKSFKSVLHVGGGAYYFHESLRQIIPSVGMIETDVEKLNARGYAVLANRLAQRQLQRGA